MAKVKACTLNRRELFEKHGRKQQPFIIDGKIQETALTTGSQD